MSKDTASFGDVLEALLTTPLLAARVTYQSLFHPTQLYKDVTLGDRQAMKNALGYWIMIVGSAIGLGLALRKSLGIESSFAPAFGSNIWTRLFDAYLESALAQQVMLIGMFLLICFVWYLPIRMLAGKNRIAGTQFLHSCIYPSASAQLVVFVFGAVLMLFVVYVPIDAQKPLSMASPLACSDLSKYVCKSFYVTDQYRFAATAMNLAIFAPWIWSWGGISVIVKDKLGIRKRVTLGALLVLVAAYFVVVILLVVGAVVVTIWSS
jgi:hypothetical protein